MAVICEKCGHHNGFAPSTELDQFTVPFGKYKGQKLVDLVKTDLEYLKWLGGVAKPNLKSKVEAVLASLAK